MEVGSSKMSSFPAMISNEPPPIDSDEDEDDGEDEFRSNGLRLDVSADPSPMSSPRKLPLPQVGSLSNNHKVSPLARTPEVPFVNGSTSKTRIEIEDDEDEDPSNTSPVGSTPVREEDKDCGYYTISQPSNGDSIQGHEFTDGLSMPPDADTIQCSNLVEPVPETEPFEKSVQSEPGDTEPCSKLEEPEPLNEQSEDDQWEFHSFEAYESQAATNQDEIDDDDEDRFGSFATSEASSFPVFEARTPEYPAQSSVFPLLAPCNLGDCEAVQVQAVSSAQLCVEEEDDDDFGDFESSKAKGLLVPDVPTSALSCSLSPALSACRPPTMRRESIQLEEKLDALVKSVFNHHPVVGADFPLANAKLNTLETLDEQLNRACNPTWTHIHDFEESHCLVHKWPRSSVHHLLLNSLHIDYSNIVYSTKFGTIQVPKFAASLVDSPLLPETLPVRPQTIEFSTGFEDFGKIERLDDDSPETTPSPVEPPPSSRSTAPMNKEAIRILEQLPDLSYMLAKTLVFPRNPNY